jgi:hypothetical protein
MRSARVKEVQHLLLPYLGEGRPGPVRVVQEHPQTRRQWEGENLMPLVEGAARVDQEVELLAHLAQDLVSILWDLGGHAMKARRPRFE